MSKTSKGNVRDVYFVYGSSLLLLLWPPCVADSDIIFLPCGFFYLLSSSFLFPHLILAVGDWMSTILLHMVWPYCKFRM